MSELKKPMFGGGDPIPLEKLNAKSIEDAEALRARREEVQGRLANVVTTALGGLPVSGGEINALTEEVRLAEERAARERAEAEAAEAEATRLKAEADKAKAEEKKKSK